VVGRMLHVWCVDVWCGRMLHATDVACRSWSQRCSDHGVAMMVLSCGRLTDLDLSMTEIGDAALGAIANRCTMLESLNISG
jgi:hypothetical protein